MKKSNIIIIFIILFTNLLFAQSKFDKGFEVGYKKGFCQDQGVGCMEPVTPISPVPGVNESYNSYSDGYNRGFTMGLKKRKTNKSQNSVPQYSRPARKYNKTKSSINLDYINSTLKNKQSKIDYNRARSMSKVSEVYDFYEVLKNRKLSPSLQISTQQHDISQMRKHHIFQYIVHSS